MTKKCSKCGDVKDIELFHKDNHLKDKHRSICADCGRAQSKRYQRNHMKVYHELNKRYRETLKGRFRVWKLNAKNRDISFDITLQDLEKMPQKCYYTGMFLTYESNQCNTISLDRLDSSKGYAPDNVVFCCAWVNIMKQSMSYEQFILGCRIILDHHNRKQWKQ
jgi:hypothetical protein